MSTKPSAQDDALLLMDMYRLMRDGGFRTAAAFKTALKEAYPNEPEERLQRILADLVRRLQN